jgi:hypothetical protein
MQSYHKDKTKSRIIASEKAELITEHQTGKENFDWEI